MKIAVAIDGSENALRAAKHAIMIVKGLPEAELEVIYVSDFNKIKDAQLLSQSPESLLLKREQKVQPVLELAKEAGVKTNINMLKGNPSQEIINYANSEEIEELVIGSRGLNTLQEIILGSVSQKIIKHVNCPITIVK